MLNRDKLLEWTKYGIERGEIHKEGAFQAQNDQLYWKMQGGINTLNTLLEQIEAGTFDVKAHP